MKKIIRLIMILLFSANLYADQYETFVVRTKDIIRVSFNEKVNINNISAKVVNKELHIMENGTVLKIIDSINFTSVSILKKSSEFHYIELKIN